MAKNKSDDKTVKPIYGKGTFKGADGKEYKEIVSFDDKNTPEPETPVARAKAVESRSNAKLGVHAGKPYVSGSSEVEFSKESKSGGRDSVRVKVDGTYRDSDLNIISTPQGGKFYDNRGKGSSAGAEVEVKKSFGERVRGFFGGKVNPDNSRHGAADARQSPDWEANAGIEGQSASGNSSAYAGAALKGGKGGTTAGAIAGAEATSQGEKGIASARVDGALYANGDYRAGGNAAVTRKAGDRTTVGAGIFGATEQHHEGKSTAGEARVLVTKQSKNDPSVTYQTAARAGAGDAENREGNHRQNSGQFKFFGLTFGRKKEGENADHTVYAETTHVDAKEESRNSRRGRTETRESKETTVLAGYKRESKDGRYSADFAAGATHEHNTGKTGPSARVQLSANTWSSNDETLINQSQAAWNNRPVNLSGRVSDDKQALIEADITAWAKAGKKDGRSPEKLTKDLAAEHQVDGKVIKSAANLAKLTENNATVQSKLTAVENTAVATVKESKAEILTTANRLRGDDQQLTTGQQSQLEKAHKEITNTKGDGVFNDVVTSRGDKKVRDKTPEKNNEIPKPGPGPKPVPTPTPTPTPVPTPGGGNETGCCGGEKVVSTQPTPKPGQVTQDQAMLAAIEQATAAQAVAANNATAEVKPTQLAPSEAARAAQKADAGKTA